MPMNVFHSFALTRRTFSLGSVWNGKSYSFERSLGRSFLHPRAASVNMGSFKTNHLRRQRDRGFNADT